MAELPTLRVNVQQLEAFRRSRGWSITMLAAQLGISETEVRNLAQWKTSPGPRVVARLSLLSGQPVPFCVIEEAAPARGNRPEEGR